MCGRLGWRGRCETYRISANYRNSSCNYNTLRRKLHLLLDHYFMHCRRFRFRRLFWSLHLHLMFLPFSSTVALSPICARETINHSVDCTLRTVAIHWSAALFSRRSTNDASFLQFTGRCLSNDSTLARILPPKVRNTDYHRFIWNISHYSTIEYVKWRDVNHYFDLWCEICRMTALLPRICSPLFVDHSFPRFPHAMPRLPHSLRIASHLLSLCCIPSLLHVAIWCFFELCGVLCPIGPAFPTAR